MIRLIQGTGLTLINVKRRQPKTDNLMRYVLRVQIAMPAQRGQLCDAWDRTWRIASQVF